MNQNFRLGDMSNSYSHLIVDTMINENVFKKIFGYHHSSSRDF